MLKKFGKLLTHKPKPEKARSIQQIAIFGSSHAKPESKVVMDAYKVCKQLAEAGYIIVNGGGPGVMRAATLGAKDGGGKVIGVTLYPKDIPHFEGRDPSNLFDVEIKTKTYVERTLALMKEGQVYIVFNGGTGTISEFGMAWGLARIYFGHHKPLILYGNFWKKIIHAFKQNMIIVPEELQVYKIADDPDGVLREIKDFEDEIAKGKHKHLKTTKGDYNL
ncbi:LOG family protein [Candidatus Daviesbacteria bacterium]|nr:LOG family protein [Candidatus Daviesbacteria bacterium]